MNSYQEAIATIPQGDDAWLHRYKTRGILVKQFAWAIPCDEAIAACVKLSPIVEIGAGTGYWASLIAKDGGRIRCFDMQPAGIRENSYGHTIQHYPILPIDWLNWHSTGNSTLMLCWPPMSTMAVDALQRYRGKTVIYIGEGKWGCTADDAFHDVLDAEWQQEDLIHLPQWDGIHYAMEVWRRQ